jgi:prepilin-type N-terminal cleavage/methylation domain-containing protein
MRGERRGRDSAFTLLEILAVVSIFALIAGLAMPNFSALHSRNLKQQAQRLVAQLELARQRAIVTGVPHRLYIDIDGSAYRIEWFASEQVANGGDDWDSLSASDTGGMSGTGGISDMLAMSGTSDAPMLADSALDEYGREPIDLSPPTAEVLDYRPVKGVAGHLESLDDSIFFAGVETDGGWVDSGETWIGFERDGSADFTIIEIEHESGPAATLEILPLADTIRVAYATE